MKNFTCRLLAIPTIIVVLFSGCATEPVEVDENYGHIRFQRPENVVYQEIPSDGCELAVPVNLHAVAGASCSVEVQLVNHSRRKLHIQEWYMIDQYNFSIFYRRHPADRPLDPATAFEEYTVRIPAKPQPRHSELILNPGNRAVLTVNLPFVGNLAPGENAIYEVFIATSLKTFKIRSKTFLLYAR